MAATPVIRVHDLVLSYGGEPVCAPVSFTLGAGRALFEPSDLSVEFGETPPVTGMDAKLALQLLQLHGSRRPKGSGVKPADVEATRREILAKVAAIKAARAREGGDGVAI